MMWCGSDRGSDGDSSQPSEPDMAQVDMKPELPSAEECAEQATEEDCVALGCTRWRVSIATWTYSEQSGCQLEARGVPFCWVNPQGRRTSSNALTYYCQTTTEGEERIAYISDDVGEVSGWRYCHDWVWQVGCPPGGPSEHLLDE